MHEGKIYKEYLPCLFNLIHSLNKLLILEEKFGFSSSLRPEQFVTYFNSCTFDNPNTLVRAYFKQRSEPSFKLFHFQMSNFRIKLVRYKEI